MNQPAPPLLLRLAPWVVAGALGVAALWVTRQNVSLQQENAALRTESQLAGVAYKMAQNQLTERSLFAESMINRLGRQLRHAEDLARLKVCALLPPAGPRGEAQVIVVWDAEQQAGLLAFDQLPVLDGSQDYQLWVTGAGVTDPISGGVVPVSNRGPGALVFKPGQPVAQAAAFAISLEKKGGVPKAEGTILLLGK